ncbi:putative leucine-rich repeat-containing protein DDB_G0290503 [Chironomus tepperi]|uniref:putative leucine-rich repeat-containing protein DDB_G0290503 n=1 Tax=Chironomus tepperi TaxID=113505 RepID=UPI00391F60D5
MAKNQFVSEYGELSNEILLNVAQLLTLRLPEGSERIIASKWVKKFQACDPNSYQQYLSLFVSCLTKQLLVDPFDTPPKDMSNQWQNFQRVYNQQDINNAVIHRLYKDSFTPPYQLDLSSNMKEYVAFQEIPFFGAHFYYAFSPREQIDKWTKFNKMNIPKNLVEILRKDEHVESPVKGRLIPKVQSRPAAEPSKISIKPKTPKVLGKKKPEWEDLIEPEESEAEPERKQPTIVIPTDVPAKNIPPALQRRMAKAEQERQERLAKKAHENKDKSSKGAVPKKSLPQKRSVGLKPSASQKTPSRPQKTKKVVAVDDIDASLMSQTLPTIQTEPKSPEFTGPHADIQRRLFHLRQSNLPPSELIKATQDISQVSADINREAERLQRDGTANLQNVERLHNTGLSVGNRILNMLKEHQAEQLNELAENAAGALENVGLTMEQLNDMLEQGAQTHDETLKRLNVIKERMQQSAFNAQNASIRMNEMKMGHELMDVMDNMLDVNENSAYQLQHLQAETQNEGILIEGLENSSQQLAYIIQEQRERLSRALENNEPALLPLIEQTVKTVDEILSSSFNENIQLVKNADRSRNAIKAIEIDSQKHEQLNDMNERTLQILHDVELAISKVMAVDDDLIDIDSQNLGFTDVMDENEMERQRQLKLKERQERLEEILERSRMAANYNGAENLEDISSTLVTEIQNSITEIDQVLIPGLQKLEVHAEYPQDRDTIHEAIEIIEQHSEVLHNSLMEMINLRDAVANEKEGHVDYDLMTFEDDDLIEFD